MDVPMDLPMDKPMDKPMDVPMDVPMDKPMDMLMDLPMETDTLVSSSNMEKTKYVSRAAWGAIPPKRTEPLAHPIQNIVYTFNLKVDKCNTREECEEYLRETQRKHIRVLKDDDLPYNFYIGGDGAVYEGRGWYSVSHKKLPEKKEIWSRRLDIAFIGNYTDVEDRSELMSPGMDLTQYGILLKMVDPEHDLIEIPDLGSMIRDN